MQLDGQEWVEISDGVWPEVIATQPKRFIVRVKDLPGMARRRRLPPPFFCDESGTGSPGANTYIQV